MSFPNSLLWKSYIIRYKQVNNDEIKHRKIKQGLKLFINSKVPNKTPRFCRLIISSNIELETSIKKYKSTG